MPTYLLPCGDSPSVSSVSGISVIVVGCPGLLGFVTGRCGLDVVPSLPIEMSAHALNSSWEPHPTAPSPLGQIPQLLPAIYFH